MFLDGIKIGFAITGCFGILGIVNDIINKMMDSGAEIIPIISYSVYATNKWNDIDIIKNKKIIHTIQEAQEIACNNMIDVMVIAPCTGNTIAKIANGIADTPVTVCAKYNLINDHPVVIGPHVVDGLSINACNVGKLLDTKNIYFVPFRQPNPITKPTLISFDINYIINTVQKALNKEQIQPLLL